MQGVDKEGGDRRSNIPYRVFSLGIICCFLASNFSYSAGTRDQSLTDAAGSGDGAQAQALLNQGAEAQSIDARNPRDMNVLAREVDNIEDRYEIGASAGYAHSFRFTAAEPNNRKSELSPLFLWWSMPLRYHLRLGIEPNVGAFYRQKGSTMVGVNATLRYYPLVSGRILPFIGGGGGVLYTRFSQLSSNINFSVFPEAGLNFFLTDRLSLMTGYRMYHISNGYLRSPNVGINWHLVTLGITWFYGDTKKGRN